ncbi:MAG: HlyD family efflux transporter periplasmic adaptor subunit, partial [Deltaproteobacteria bacterium]|nr:HlyD family efflux transporter periplasmic adaptor subunit [Deltaproteobacteria bacterium]
MRNKSILIKCLLPILILAAGFGGMRLLALSKQPPQKQVRENPGALVETFQAQSENRRIRVRATGTVQPAQTADISPQVSGRVISLSPDFVAGGFFKEGEILFEIDPADYELSVQQSRAGVAQAEYQLAQVESQARIARIEWGRINLENKGKPNPLVLHEPQLKNAKASLESARADLARRLLDMERTKVYAPFDGRIRSENIDPGQYLTFGKSIGVIAGTKSAEIVVPITLDNLAWLDVPRDQQSRDGGSPAEVRLAVGAKTHTWPGRV